MPDTSEHRAAVHHYSAVAEPASTSTAASTSEPVSKSTLAALAAQRRTRNIGISAHIDSGKTTLTERILFLTGRIGAIHEVRGKDGVGATMDSMDLEREKGITIQSAATRCRWAGWGPEGEEGTTGAAGAGSAMDDGLPLDSTVDINVIDTPGHVDFTIEVERALRVLDGAILVLCSVGGVQAQTAAVDRQMRRYSVPRLCFVNKCDRVGARPDRVVKQLRDMLGLNAALIQTPIGLEDRHEGHVCLVTMEGRTFHGDHGLQVRRMPLASLPNHVQAEAAAARAELVERLAEIDDAVAEPWLEDGPDAPALMEDGGRLVHEAIRRATIARRFAPVLVGSAYKDRGVQPLLDAVRDYLPAPSESPVVALLTDPATGAEVETTLAAGPTDPAVAYAFKLEEGRHGQLTYVRTYQGILRRGDTLLNTSNRRRARLSRLVRPHADQLEDVEEAGPGDIVALFGIECASGDTFVAADGPGAEAVRTLSLASLYIPPPVMKLSLTPARKDGLAAFGRALSRFQREDPTFRVESDDATGQTIVAGMGELHLEVYVERLRREYGLEVSTGAPRVQYRETIGRRASFDYTHKKQTGGQGQYGRVVGYIEPVSEEEIEEEARERRRISAAVSEAAAAASSGGGSKGKRGGGGGRAPPPVDAPTTGSSQALHFRFENELVGNAIPPGLIPAIARGFEEACASGALVGHPVERVRVVLTDGNAHAVDSSELAFKLAARGAFRQAFAEAEPGVLEPVMSVEVRAPPEAQGGVVADLSRRRGVVTGTNGGSGSGGAGPAEGAAAVADEATLDAVVRAHVPLAEMFGYSTVLRGATQGRGEFSMSYSSHERAPKDVADRLVAEHGASTKGKGGDE